MWSAVLVTYHLISRLAYVVGVGVSLRWQERDQFFTRRDGVEAGYRRFVRFAAFVMHNDGVSFVVMCMLTHHTLRLPSSIPRAASLGVGIVLVLIGVGIKVWATLSLGQAGYYWRNFFTEEDPIATSPPGPYKYVDNPMYTIGYLQTYGLAFVFLSLPALVFSVIDQGSMLVFFQLVEKPHYRRVLARAAARERPAIVVGKA
jgi:protein-S-isoprenylcysteine O-methyltransferase Ste14